MVGIFSPAFVTVSPFPLIRPVRRQRDDRHVSYRETVREEKAIQVCSKICKDPVRFISHAPADTSETAEEALKDRGVTAILFTKSLLLTYKKGKNRHYIMAILPAGEKLETRALSTLFSIPRPRFATPEEMVEACGSTPGSVSPLDVALTASPQPVAVVISTRIAGDSRLVVSAGSDSLTAIISGCDLMRICQHYFSQTIVGNISAKTMLPKIKRSVKAGSNAI